MFVRWESWRSIVTSVLIKRVLNFGHGTDTCSTRSMSELKKDLAVHCVSTVLETVISDLDLYSNHPESFCRPDDLAPSEKLLA